MRAPTCLFAALLACSSAAPDSRVSVASSRSGPRAEARPTSDMADRAHAIDKRCPEGMVYIPAATFMMGTTADDPNDQLHQVTITKPYCIDRTPVTVAAYSKCVEAKACTAAHKPLDYNYERPGRDNHPINGVEWAQADGFCKWAGKRLPTDAEWELAARGTDGRKYPWGNEEPDDTRLWWSRNVPREGTSPVGTHPAGASPYGVLEMLGNVDQWVADYGGIHSADPTDDPSGPASGESRVVRGAAYDSSLGELHIGDGGPRDPLLEAGTTGVRCCAAPSSL